jgi:hypothetical protein
MEPIDFIVECPHCKNPVLIEKLNCCIFRHGILKHNGTQIDPHCSKELCDYYIEKQLIFGCGKPFQIIPNEKSTNNDDRFITVICDYI